MTRTITVIIIQTMATMLFGQYSSFFSNKKVHFNYKCPEECSITVDGLLNDQSWSNVAWITDFSDIINRPVHEPAYETKVKTRWDNRYLYLAAEIYQEHIWASIHKKDSTLYQENVFEIFIDPSGDTHNYFEIEMNALGTIWDLMMTRPYRDGGIAMSSWDIKGLEKAVSIHGTLNDGLDMDKKWTLELAIPLSEIMISSSDLRGKAIRMNLGRTLWNIQYVNNEYEKTSTDASYWAWSPQKTLSFHEPERWGYLYFLHSKDDPSNFENSHQKNEEAKGVLREVYYAEKEMFKTQGAYTSNLKLLELRVDTSKIQVFCTPSLFEALLQMEDRCWHINQDGKTWSTLNHQQSLTE